MRGNNAMINNIEAMNTVIKAPIMSRIDWKRFNEFINVSGKNDYNEKYTKKLSGYFLDKSSDMIITQINEPVFLDPYCLCLDDGSGEDAYYFMNKSGGVTFSVPKDKVISIEFLKSKFKLIDEKIWQEEDAACVIDYINGNIRLFLIDYDLG